MCIIMICTLQFQASKRRNVLSRMLNCILMLPLSRLKKIWTLIQNSSFMKGSTVLATIMITKISEKPRSPMTISKSQLQTHSWYHKSRAMVVRVLNWKKIAQQVITNALKFLNTLRKKMYMKYNVVPVKMLCVYHMGFGTVRCAT